jgi:hypothetical protein
MEEHELRESLRRLPDARPGAEFTAEVLARVERYERQRALAAGAAAGEGAPGGALRWRPTLLAGGLAAALVAAVGLWQPLDGGRWSGVGGDRIAAPEAPGAERLGEEGIASVVPRSERLAERADRARLASGAGAADAAQPPTVETPGAPDPLGTRVGSPSPQRGRSQPSPLVDRGSAAPDADGSSREERLASATAVAGGGIDVSGADRREGAAPPTAALTAGSAAALPGADFFAAPPTGAGGAAAVLPAAERLARLRAERESLERRLVAFRSELPPAEPPVVLLGGDEGLELVFDLARWAAPPPAAEASGAARPAVHSTQGPPRRF